MNRNRLLVGVIVLALLVVGAFTVRAALSPVVPVSTMPPLGVYMTTFSPEEETSPSNSLRGDWELRFLESNRFTLTRSGAGEPIQEGVLTVAQGQLVFPPAQGTYGCVALDPGTGTYKWAFDGKTLTFTSLEDQCPRRVTQLTKHPWIKQQ